MLRFLLVIYNLGNCHSQLVCQGKAETEPCAQNIEQYGKLTFTTTLSGELHGSWDMVEEEECVAGVTHLGQREIGCSLLKRAFSSLHGTEEVN